MIHLLKYLVNIHNKNFNQIRSTFFIVFLLVLLITKIEQDTDIKILLLDFFWQSCFIICYQTLLDNMCIRICLSFSARLFHAFNKCVRFCLRNAHKSSFDKRRHFANNRWQMGGTDVIGALERLDTVLSEFCPGMWPWAVIAVALPAFMYGQNWRYYL